MPKERTRTEEGGNETKVLLIDIKDSIMANIWQLPDLAANLISQQHNSKKKKNKTKNMQVRMKKYRE